MVFKATANYNYCVDFEALHLVEIDSEVDCSLIFLILYPLYIPIRRIFRWVLSILGCSNQWKGWYSTVYVQATHMSIHSIAPGVEAWFRFSVFSPILHHDLWSCTLHCYCTRHCSLAMHNFSVWDSCKLLLLGSCSQLLCSAWDSCSSMVSTR